MGEKLQIIYLHLMPLCFATGRVVAPSEGIYRSVLVRPPGLCRWFYQVPGIMDKIIHMKD